MGDADYINLKSVPDAVQDTPPWPLPTLHTSPVCLGPIVTWNKVGLPTLEKLMLKSLANGGVVGAPKRGEAHGKV
jgi:hypothetical protein